MTPAARGTCTPPVGGRGLTCARPTKHRSVSPFASSVLHTVTTTMLTFIQLIVLLCWTSVGSADAEKLFHHRDHSDVQNLHRAEVISDESSAQVKIWNE